MGKCYCFVIDQRKDRFERARERRNRRRIREAYRIHEGQMTPGWDMVVVARVRAAYAPYAELERDLLRLLDKLGVRKGEGKP